MAKYRVKPYKLEAIQYNRGYNKKVKEFCGDEAQFLPVKKGQYIVKKDENAFSLV